MVGEVIKLDVDSKGFAFGESLRARVWIKVQEPLMRWVLLELARTKETILYDIQYEGVPYFCFSCGHLGHAEAFCPEPGERDADGFPPYGEKLR